MSTYVLIHGAGSDAWYGFAPDEMDDGHLPALGHPDELVERLERYRAEANL